jgi:hypothetical protein
MDEGAQTITLSKNATAAGTTAALSAGFQTVGRRLKRWDDTPNQPALFIRHTEDDDDWSNAPLSITTAEVEVWIYSRTGADPDGIPDKGLNMLVRKVRESLGPDDNYGQFFTIGGRCHWPASKAKACTTMERWISKAKLSCQSRSPCRSSQPQKETKP